MRRCVIFNPTAKGDKARRFRQALDRIGTQSALKSTTGPGDARKLAAEAVQEGFEVVVAAGGDGTLNEVLNGIADVPGGLQRARLGVLPLGTVNVFARETGIPRDLDAAWTAILSEHETTIDLPWASYAEHGGEHRRYFAQLAGAGLDARAIELVDWSIKKKVGPFAYVWAGLQALTGPPAKITVSNGREQLEAALVLIGNGRLYGGDYRLFPGADMRDGFLEVCVFPRVNWFRLAQCGPSLLLRGCLPPATHVMLRGERIVVTGVGDVPFEVDGELAGRLPVTFSVSPSSLRVIIP